MSQTQMELLVGKCHIVDVVRAVAANVGSERLVRVSVDLLEPAMASVGGHHSQQRRMPRLQSYGGISCRFAAHCHVLTCHALQVA